MRLQCIYHEAKLFTALRTSHEILNFIKHQHKLDSFALHIAPHIFYTKSQEVVYKKTGSSAGPKFKAAHVKDSVPKKSAQIPELEHTATSVALPLNRAEDPSQFGHTKQVLQAISNTSHVRSHSWLMHAECLFMIWVRCMIINDSRVAVWVEPVIKFILDHKDSKISPAMTPVLGMKKGANL